MSKDKLFSHQHLKRIKHDSLCYANCQEHVTMLCQQYAVKNYYFKEYINADIGIIICENDRKEVKKYVAYFDINELVVKIRDTNGFVERIFSEVNCWRLAIKYMSEVIV